MSNCDKGGREADLKYETPDEIYLFQVKHSGLKWSAAVKRHLRSAEDNKTLPLHIALFTGSDPDALEKARKEMRDFEEETRRMEKRAEALLKDQPPLPSDFLVALLVPYHVGQDFLGNMEILFAERWIPKYGVRRARLVWTSQSIQFVLGHWLGRTLDALGKLKPFLGG